jgi:hypothetical protein
MFAAVPALHGVKPQVPSRLFQDFDFAPDDFFPLALDKPANL